MIRKMALATVAVFMSTSVTLAISNAPQPGGKGMQRMMRANSVQTSSTSGCATSSPSTSTDVRKIHNAMVAGGRDGRIAASMNSVCHNSVDSIGSPEHRSSYTKP